MRILLLSHFAGSSRHGMIFRNYAMASEWVKQGHTVTIVGCGFSHFRSIQPKFSGRVGKENIDGINYVWLWGPKYTKDSNVGRVFSMAAFTVQCIAFPLPLEDSYDIVICSSPHPFVIYPARLYARKYKARLIYDIRDLWPLTLVLIGNISPKHPFVRLMQRAEDYACAHADLVTAVPRNAGPYLVSRGLPPGRFLAIANGAVLDDSPAAQLPLQHSQCINSIREEGGFILGYAGTLGTANAMNVIVSAMPSVSKRVHLVIVGDGGDKESLQKQAQLLGCSDNVHFLPSISRREVASFLKKIDVGFAGTHKSALYDYGASLTKINDYMLSALPILYAVGDAGNPVELSGGGVCCEPDNSAALAGAINELALREGRALREMGEKGKSWCLANQLVSEQAKLIINTLNELPLRQIK